MNPLLSTRFVVKVQSIFQVPSLDFGLKFYKKYFLREFLVFDGCSTNFIKVIHETCFALQALSIITEFTLNIGSTILVKGYQQDK